MRNQDEKLAKAQAESERLRNENHNLKRQVKRMKEKDTARKAEQKAALERNRIADVKAWERDNLSENLVAKRAHVLRPAC